MEIIKNKINIKTLEKMSEKMYGGLVKAVVDIEREIMVVDAELHADELEFILDNGSTQENVWGINIHPTETGDDFIEFDSMINIRPQQNNRSRSVEDTGIQEKILKITNKLIEL